MRKRAYGTHEIARLCQVTPPTVGRWIDGKKIPSFTTAGGHHRVWGKDLAALLRSLNIPLPPELADVPPVILIVEDEAIIRQMVRRHVQKLCPDARLEEAQDGFEAGHKIATHLPSLVILDLYLPGVNGFKICRTVRDDEKLKNVRIIAVTGREVDESRRKILDAGADDFLAKPFSLEELTGKLEKWLPNIESGRAGEE